MSLSYHSGQRESLTTCQCACSTPLLVPHSASYSHTEVPLNAVVIPCWPPNENKINYKWAEDGFVSMKCHAPYSCLLAGTIIHREHTPVGHPSA